MKISTGRIVRIPRSGDGRRSSTNLARHVLSGALAGVSELSGDAMSEQDWHRNYPRYFSAATEVAMGRVENGLSVAQQGLESFLSAMRLVAPDGEHDISSFGDARIQVPETEFIHPSGKVGRPTRLSIPYKGDVLEGSALHDQIGSWVDSGIVEPAFGRAVLAASDSPECLSVPGKAVVLLGAGASMGPMRHLCRWGASVYALDLPTEGVQNRIRTFARSGTNLVGIARDRDRIVPGLSLAAEPERIAAWISKTVGGDAPVIANLMYADGPSHVELTAAAILVSEHLRRERPDTTVAYLATPTDAFLSPADAVAHSRRRLDDSEFNSVVHKALRSLSRGRLFAPAYPVTRTDSAGDTWGLVDTIVSAQGPNYALAKRVQRWHATVSAANGSAVSANVAPASWTTSVTKNRSLSAAYRGAHHFGVEIFEPDTASALMAAKLVADLAGLGEDRPENPEAMFSHDAAHGGLWRVPFAPMSALPVAAIIGLARRG